MADIFDDGLSSEELAIALGFADAMTEEERNRRRMLQDDEQALIPDENEPQWYEKD